MSRFVEILSAIVTILFISSSSLVALTTLPVMKTVDLGDGFVMEIPADWVATTRAALSAAFATRAGATLTDAFHPPGSRPTDLPYATVEQLRYAGLRNPTATQQRELADQILTYYQTAFNPPSRADRPPSFKSAIVSPLVFDSINRRFHFSVVAKYDLIPDRTIDVAGCFGPSGFTIVTVWCEADDRTTHLPAIVAMRDSIRLGTPVVKPATPGVILKRTAQIGGVLLIVVVVGVQVLVIWRERQQRRADMQRIFSEIES